MALLIINVEFNESISIEICSESDIINDVISYFNGDIKIEFVATKEVLK